MLHDDYLLFGDPSEVAAFLGVSPRTLRRYQKDPCNMPEACKKLLRLRLEGDLRALGGNDWDGFYFKRGELYIPGWRNGWKPAEIKALFFVQQEAAALRNEVRRLRADLWAARKVQALRVPALPVKFDRRRA